MNSKRTIIISVRTHVLGASAFDFFIEKRFMIIKNVISINRKAISYINNLVLLPIKRSGLTTHTNKHKP